MSPSRSTSLVVTRGALKQRVRVARRRRPRPAPPATLPAVVRPAELGFGRFLSDLWFPVERAAASGARDAVPIPGVVARPRLLLDRRRPAPAGRGFGRNFRGAAAPFAWARCCSGGALPCGLGRRAAPSAGGRRGAGRGAARLARRRSPSERSGRSVRRRPRPAGGRPPRRAVRGGGAGPGVARRHGTWAAAAAAAPWASGPSTWLLAA